MKNINLLATIAAVIMTAACQTLELDNEKEVVVEPQRTTIPFSLKVNPAETKVSYDGSYSFIVSGENQDKIQITGKDRTDIEGTLEYDSTNNDFEGTISYVGELPDETVLVATLVHAGNNDVSSYASGGVGYVNPADELVPSVTMKEAVEKYSLLQAEFRYDNTETLSLEQKAAFLNVIVTFSFVGDTQQMTDGAIASVDLGSFIGHTTLVKSSTENKFTAKFLAVVPADQLVKNLDVKVCDRKLDFSSYNDSDATLTSNKLYKVKRNILFKPELGDPFWSDGTYGRLSHDNATIVGIIVYVNHHYDESTEAEKAARDNALTEKSGNNFGNALVMALKNADDGNGVAWSTTNNHKYTSEFIDSPPKTINYGGNSCSSWTSVSGYTNTYDIIANDGNCIAPWLAKQYLSGEVYDGTTGWFLPSIGQWIYAISEEGFGGAVPATEWVNGNGVNWLNHGGPTDLIKVKDNTGINFSQTFPLVAAAGEMTNNYLVDYLNERLLRLVADFESLTINDVKLFGDSVNGLFGDNYWTSSEKSASEALRLNLGSVEKDNNNHYWSTIKATGVKKNYTKTTNNNNGYKMKVRPFLAF